MNGQADVEVDYKRKYKNLKRKLKFLVYVSIKLTISALGFKQNMISLHLVFYGLTF